MNNVSVIIPVYNKEKTLKECLNSVIDSDLEIILVDDKSTDSSLDILKSYKEHYENIKLIENSKNLGVSESRNKALEISSGKYIGFCDADDIVDKHFYNILFNEAVKNSNPDIVRGNFKIIHYNELIDTYVEFFENKLRNFKNGDMVTDKKLFLKQETISSCSKIYRRDFLNEGFKNISFEDEEFTLRNLINANSILYLDSVSYKYVVGEGLHNKRNSKGKEIFDVFKIYEDLLNLDKKYYSELLYRLNCSIYSKMLCINNWDITDDIKFQLFQIIFDYMNYKYPKWKENICYDTILTDEKLFKYLKFVNKFTKNNSLEKAKTLIKS